MFAIVTTEDGGEIKLIGPFTTQETAEQYAKRNKYWGVSICVQLHDCGNAMDEHTNIVKMR